MTEIDQGRHWTKLTAPLRDPDSAPDHMYPEEVESMLLTRKGVLLVAADSLLLRSADEGGHWEKTGAGVRGTRHFALAAAPTGEVILGTDRGLFISDDDGRTWKQMAASFRFWWAPNARNLYPTIAEIVVDADGRIYAMAHGGYVFCGTPVHNKQ